MVIRWKQVLAIAWVAQKNRQVQGAGKTTHLHLQTNKSTFTMSAGQHDRVQRELDELRQKHLTSHRRDEMKDSK
jgi:hypothetical protein